MTNGVENGVDCSEKKKLKTLINTLSNVVNDKTKYNPRRADKNA